MQQTVKVFDVFVHMCVLSQAASLCVCVHVCVCQAIPELSGVVSSEPIDGFSTVAAGVTTPLYTGHTHWPRRVRVDRSGVV